MSSDADKKNQLPAEEPSISSVQCGFDNLFSPKQIATNKIFTEIPQIAWSQLQHALAPVENGVWELIVKDKEMCLYRTVHEEGGIVCDPIKAVHSVVVLNFIIFFYY